MKVVSVIRAAIAIYNLAVVVIGSAIEDLDKAILDDIIESYITHNQTTCNTTDQASATSFSFTWPGTNTQSSWNTEFIGYEQGLFQAIMSYNDPTGNRSWSIRIGSGGNMYSIIYPDLFGEIIPPQEHSKAPWIDEVHQMVATAQALNSEETNPNYMHQAGAYQEDNTHNHNYTKTPFYSPSLAKHCSGNSCTFASWGTQAWVPTQYTSNVIYINRYTNCNNGIIEHTQMVHNFINPGDILNDPKNDITHLDVPWAGVRPSKLAYALEPLNSDSLSFNNVNTVNYLPLCKWQFDDKKVLSNTQGYTTFASVGLLVNQTGFPNLSLPCRKSGDCGSDINDPKSKTCMVQSCTDAQIINSGYTRIQLKVAAYSQSPCDAAKTEHRWNGLVMLRCDFHDTGFGVSPWKQTSYHSCSPWTDVGLFNSLTGRGVHVAFLKHWSYAPNDKKLWFAVYSTDSITAVNTVNAIFNNIGNSNALPIEVRPLRKSAKFPQVEASTLTKLPLASVPADYNPSNLAAFTYVYGKGEDYNGEFAIGNSRRRIGSTWEFSSPLRSRGRDYTVFNVNWYSGARLAPGDTYTNRGYYFGSNLGNVQETAAILRAKVAIDNIYFPDWNPRRLDIYKTSSKFMVKASPSSRGQSTTCANWEASLVCSGLTTPRMGYVPFFYVKCQNTTYLGPDPYHFSPPFGSQFPGHGNKTNGLLVRSYVCNGMIKSSRNLQTFDGFYDHFMTNNDDFVEYTDDDGGISGQSGQSPFINDTSVRPSWKMIGFFPVNYTTSCSLGESNIYDESVCNANPTSLPTSMPTSTPTTPSPTSTPTTPSPTSTPTSKPTSTPTSKPTSTPTSSPVRRCIPIGWRLSSYGIRCACNTPRCYGPDTSGQCCSGKCRITSRGVSVCRP